MLTVEIVGSVEEGGQLGSGEVEEKSSAGVAVCVNLGFPGCHAGPGRSQGAGRDSKQD